MGAIIHHLRLFALIWNINGFFRGERGDEYLVTEELHHSRQHMGEVCLKFFLSDRFCKTWLIMLKSCCCFFNLSCCHFLTLTKLKYKIYFKTPKAKFSLPSGPGHSTLLLSADCFSLKIIIQKIKSFWEQAQKSLRKSFSVSWYLLRIRIHYLFIFIKCSGYFPPMKDIYVVIVTISFKLMLNDCSASTRWPAIIIIIFFK